VFKLTIEDDEGKTTVVPLAREEMTIGRLEGNTIRLTERNVSRRHARLSQQNGALFIEDLTSFTGVRVNGTKIASPTPLREGDEVQIGDYRIVLRGEQRPPNDRPTMPNMTAVTAPMATVGGAVAIPTRASVAALAAQGTAQAAAPVPSSAPVPVPRSRTKTSPTLGVAAPVAPEAAPEPVDGQPTIPLRALGTEVADQLVGGSPARMVVLTTDLAGTELALDKASLVIGRTDENEVVLNHRSISRHHAKIVREGDHYTIVDLQSANGVRVNGEDYERVELNPGDVVELGHVKLRFIGPLESFVFDPSATREPRQFPVKLMGGVGIAVAAALVALFVHRGSRLPPSTTSGATEASAPIPPAAVAPPPAAAPAPAPPPPSTPAAILAETKQAISAEDWETARAVLDRIDVGAEDPALRREVAALGRRIAIERQGASLFAKFDELANAKDYAEALSGYEKIPIDSVYKKRARPRYEEARSLLVAEHLATAEKARAAGRCADVRAEAAAVLQLEPRNLLVRDMARLCRAHAEPTLTSGGRPTRVRASAAVAAERAEPPRRNEPARPEPARAEAASRAETAAAEPEDADALMKQAREAWLRQQCGAAMDLSRRALRAKPGLTDAYQILAVCSCSLKDADAAGRAYARLDDKNRSLVHALCQKNGIAVGE
jgi:pSer/pThr/pTyr-binding forkhead associated (FHA) protein